MQRYNNYPKVGAKNSKNYPKYHPKPKFGAIFDLSYPKVGAKSYEMTFFTAS